MSVSLWNVLVGGLSSKTIHFQQNIQGILKICYLLRRQTYKFHILNFHNFFLLHTVWQYDKNDTLSHPWSGEGGPGWGNISGGQTFLLQNMDQHVSKWHVTTLASIMPPWWHVMTLCQAICHVLRAIQRNYFDVFVKEGCHLSS